ncbi:hypothetical protein KGQ34_02965, partial [Patescibacteria group bacterium]|nr:hypothetical protein [Patescibacteria group bacterium]
MPPKKPNSKKAQDQNHPSKQDLQKNLIPKIPEIVAVLKTNDGVFFPSSAFSIWMEADSETQQFFAFLKEKPFLIVQPNLKDNTPFPIGVMCDVTNIDETNPARPSFRF